MPHADEDLFEELAKERSCCREVLEEHEAMGGRAVVNSDECTIHAGLWRLLLIKPRYCTCPLVRS